MRVPSVAVGLLAVPLVACFGGDDTVAGAPAVDAAIDGTLALDGSAPPDAADAALDATAFDATEADATALDAADAADAAPPTGVGCDPAGYPQGPYGTAVGSVLANLAFSGMTDANGDGRVTNDPAVALCLGRYHLPTAPKVLVVLWTAAWSTACQADEPGIVALAAQNQGKAAFLELQAQNVGGLPASIASAIGWGNRFGVAHDLGIDPELALAPYLPLGDAGVAFPAHLVIRTDTMRIAVAELDHTADASDVQAEIDAVLAEDAGSE